MEEHVDRFREAMDANFRRRVEENFRVIEENRRVMEENHRVIAENQAEIRTLLQQLSQAVAVLRAKDVRIDETHA